MAVVRTSLASWRRERLRACRFTVALFSALALAWPPIAFTFLALGGGPAMEDVTIQDWSTTITIDEKGREVVEERVVITFDEPATYVRPLGELSSTDDSVRYFSKPLYASIDGSEVAVGQYRWGVGGKYYTLGEELSGTHTIVFKYESPNAVYYDEDNAPVFRARLLPRFSLSDVESFEAHIVSPPMVTDEAHCWTSEAIEVKDVREEDRCTFEVLTETEARLELDDVEYLRPVRVQFELQKGAYEPYRLPWAGYWDPVLGQSLLLAPLAGLAAVAILLGMPGLTRRIGDGHGLALTAGLTALWIGLMALDRFMPSVLFLIPFALAWASIPAYIRWSEARMLTTPPVDEED